MPLNGLATAILERLSDEKRSPQADSELLAVLKTEITRLKPKLCQSLLTQKINNWNINGVSSTLSGEQQLELKVREARKMLLSGKKRPQVAEMMFNGNEQTLAQMERIVLGQP